MAGEALESTGASWEPVKELDRRRQEVGCRSWLPAAKAEGAVAAKLERVAAVAMIVRKCFY